MKEIFNFFLFILLVLGIWYWISGSHSPIGVYEKENAFMKSKIGTKIYYEKDSVTIVDYSFFKDTYTLSNGVVVNKQLIDHQLKQ